MTDTAFLRVHDLVVATGLRVPDFELDNALTLLCTGREASATTTMLTLAGRMKPVKGSIELDLPDGSTLDSPRALNKHIALAGVSSIDGLDRNVRVATYIREVSAWSSPWYRRTPTDITNIERWQSIRDLFELEIEPRAQVGSLNPTHRFVLRVALALLARPEPALVVIDDIDQVRSLDIRAELIDHLRTLSERTPVIVASTNSDTHQQFDRVISLTQGE
ncbi:hypothetical protein CKALI_06285 [Corynebacterium kalinowskii]|uniref:ABC transporter domain-containing protein n=1 Tax=Corynebacterium kalinowskii TaxID=2675216 RepID=A0A6B8VTN7_9CORY|nr:hypothetical protein [Corynebacterium kalinowskii]QGU02126.1 hypothetical protein CKALI_06285 [Corynebacterium kalinowskii]